MKSRDAQFSLFFRNFKSVHDSGLIFGQISYSLDWRDLEQFFYVTNNAKLHFGATVSLHRNCLSFLFSWPFELQPLPFFLPFIPILAEKKLDSLSKNHIGLSRFKYKMLLDLILNFLNIIKMVFLYSRFFVPAVRENLVTPEPTNHGIVGDLSAINIQRGRDHGLPPYVQFRNASGLGLASSIDNLTNIHPAQRERLREAYYDNVDDIDLYVGGMSETPLPGSIVGDTFTYILAQGFKNLRFGDRFWYERDDSHIGFTLRQLDAIRNASLARVLCDNTEGIEQTLRNVFLEKSIVNSPTNCENLKFVDLNAWKEGS